MTSAGRSWRDMKWMTAGALSPPARLRLFRSCRLVSAAVILAIFPPMALTSGEPFAAITALFLFGALPAAIAMDMRRPGALDRAILMSLLASSMILLGGAMRGIPVISATALLWICVIEAFVVGSRSIRRRALGILAFSTAMMMAAPFRYPEMMLDGISGGSMAWTTITVAILIIINVTMLANGMLQGVARERRMSQQQRIQSREIETMVSETVFATNSSGAVLRVSDNAERVLGLPAEALKARGLSELVLVADRPQLLTALCDCARGGPDRTLRLRLRTSASSEAPRYRWIAVSISHSITGGDIAMATLRDISQQVAEEERLANAAAGAETARSARAAFLSTVNHELRTPLNAIIGFSDILANPATTPLNADRVREYATIINGAGQDLLRIVTAMIDITRLDSGIYDFEAETTELASVVEAAVEAFRQEPEGKDATIRLTKNASSGSLEAPVDQRAFRTILGQILSNAVKFGGSAPVTVALGSDGEHVIVKVTDRGPGIQTEQLAALGRHFERLDESLSRDRNGIGLGLSLARGLMGLHNGRMGIESKPGKGTTVILSLPKSGAKPATASNIHALVQPSANAPAPMTDNAPERRRA
jgi:two-component system, cell cycle sensor histidine kinase DivJ